MHEVYIYQVKAVERVTDGDTYWLHVDVGFRQTMLVHTRLMGYDTAEIYSGSDYEKSVGQQAKQFVIDWFNASLETAQVFIRTEKDPDNFGRWLADVWSETGATVAVLGVELADRGFATAWPTRWKEVYDQ